MWTQLWQRCQTQGLPVWQRCQMQGLPMPRLLLLTTAWCEVLQKLRFFRLVNGSLHFMEPESSSPCSQEPASHPYPEPDRSTPHRPSCFLNTYLYTGLFVSPSGISEFDCATTKTDTAERSISIGRESLKVIFVLGALAYFQVPPLVVTKNGVHSK